MQRVCLALAVVLTAPQVRAQGDSCATAVPLVGLGSFPFSTVGATDSGVLASCKFSSVVNDGWFVWTPPLDGDYRFSICPASFDQVIAAYDVCGGVELACNDGQVDGFGTCDGDFTDASITLAGLTAGASYYIQIDSYFDSTGTGDLEIEIAPPVPANDDCANAIPLFGPGFVPVSTLRATDSGQIPICGSFSGTRDIWFTWTPSSTGDYSISTCNSNYDNLLALYEGACGSTLLACSEGEAVGFPGCNGRLEEDAGFAVSVTAGVTYTVQVGGFGANATGSGILNIVELDTPVVTLVCRPNGLDLSGCSDCPCGNGPPLSPAGGCFNSVGTSARLQVSGSDSVSAGDLYLGLTDAVPDTFAVLISGASVAPQNPANPCFGADSGVQSNVLDGLRCAVGAVQRHGARPTDSAGDLGFLGASGWGGSASLAAMGGFTAGEVRVFQAIYRDDPGLVCMTGQNSTHGVVVTFQP